MTWDFVRQVDQREFEDLRERACRELQAKFAPPDRQSLSSFACDAPYIHFGLMSNLVRDDTGGPTFRPSREVKELIGEVRQRMLDLHALELRGRRQAPQP